MRQLYLLFALIFIGLSGLAQNRVLITEVCYDSPLPEANGAGFRQRGEFIEIYNTSLAAVDISGWSIRDFKGATVFKIPNGKVINGKDFIVLTYGSKDDPVAYNFEKRFTMATQNSDKIIYYEGGGVPKLKNKGDYVKLLDASNQVVDAVAWEGVTVEGNIWNIYAKEDYSLQRIVASSYVNGVKSTPDHFSYRAPNPFVLSVSPNIDYNNVPPSMDMNFVRTEIPTIPVTNEASLSTLSAEDKVTSFQYYDGLGRPLQTITASASISGKDVISHYQYDPVTGIQNESYLPYTSNNAKPGAFIDPTKALTDLKSFYNLGGTGWEADGHPYTLTEFEDSPLMRTKSVTGVGDNWHNNNKQTTFEYIIHDGSVSGPDRLAKWSISDQVDKELTIPRAYSFYGAGEITITQSTDVQGKVSQTCMDNRGLTVATRVKKGNDWVTTYNVYDDFGQIRYVIPPVITPSSTMSAEQKAGYLFQYIYDERHRLIKEKSPGVGWTYYCYDKWDRLVMSQDAGQRKTNDWIFVKYDKHNRAIITGRKRQNTNPDNWWADAKLSTASRFENVASNETGYTTNLSLPQTHDELYTITYYDNYNFKIYSGWDAEGIDLNFKTDGLNVSSSNAVKGLVTGSKVKILNSNTWLNTISYYDDDYKNVQIVAENHLGGFDRISTESNFAGEVLKNKLSHSYLKTGNAQLTYLQEFEYDQGGRLFRAYSQINNEPKILMTEYAYNELGDVIEKNLHSTNSGSSFLQSLDYTYNIHGALRSVNKPDLSSDGTGHENRADLFGMKYHYETLPNISGVSAQKRYDGSLAAIEWKSSNAGLDAFDHQVYQYKYDDLNRLFDAKSSKSMAGSWMTGNYSSSINYEDDNGNIKSINRYTKEGTGSALMDQLTYKYQSNSNKLSEVIDAADDEKGYVDLPMGNNEYAYDNETGNLTGDANKQIENVKYNHLQLVERIDFFDGTQISFSYDAVGNKLSKKVTDSDGSVIVKVDFVGGIEYLDDKLTQISTDQGRAYKQNNKFHYEYMITDHQGNNRVSFGVLPDRKVYTTGLETDEDQFFEVPANVRQPIENHTPLGSWSAHLNNAIGKNLGPAIRLAVNTGDAVSIEAWGSFALKGTNPLGTLSNVATTLAATLGISSASSASEYNNLVENIVNPAGGIFGLNGDESPGLPQACLQWIYLNTSFEFVNAGFAKLDPNTSVYQKLSLEVPTSLINQPGYIYIYVANETNYDTDVFFDDISVTHESSMTNYKVTQVNDYYPFGMRTASSWTEPGYVAGGGYYQSYFADYDSLVGSYDFLLRNYDPALGRWWQADPYNQFGSPYIGMGNVPNMGTDPDGGWVGLAAFAAELLINTLINTSINAAASGVDALNGESFSKSFMSRGISGSSSFQMADVFPGYYQSIAYPEGYRMAIGMKQVGYWEQSGFYDESNKEGGITAKGEYKIQYLGSQSDGWRRRSRSGNYDRVSNGSAFDERGRELLGRWLNGSGEDLVAYNGRWGNYMKNNELLTDQIESYLTEDAARRKVSGKFWIDKHPEIQNGYRTGYEMLHGPHEFSISGMANLTSSGVFYKYNASWYDAIDPNNSYYGDTFYSGVAEMFYSPANYNVFISWDNSIVIPKP